MFFDIKNIDYTLTRLLQKYNIVNHFITINKKIMESKIETIYANDANLIKIASSIFQVLYVSTENQGHVWRSGTCFMIKYKSKNFIITASHCIQDNNIRDLYITNIASQKKLHSIPIKGSIKSFLTDGTKVDTDVRVLIVDQDKFDSEIQKRMPPVLNEKSILSMPKIQKIIKRYKNNPQKMMRKIHESQIYRTFLINYQNEVYKNMENTDTSLVDIRSMVLDDNFVNKNQECTFYGYPSHKSTFDYNDNAEIDYIHFHLQNHSGRLIDDYIKTTDTYKIQYTTDENLDGFSGGPVIANNRVIGVITSVETKNKQLHFVSTKTIIKSLEFAFQSKFNK